VQWKGEDENFQKQKKKKAVRGETRRERYERFGGKNKKNQVCDALSWKNLGGRVRHTRGMGKKTERKEMTKVVHHSPRIGTRRGGGRKNMSTRVGAKDGPLTRVYKKRGVGTRKRKF